MAKQKSLSQQEADTDAQTWETAFQSMIVIKNTTPVPPHCRNNVVAIGNFDGVHRGHQKLLEVAAGQGELSNRPWGVVTFEPHPQELFRPTDPLFRLTPATLKCRLLASLGATFTAVLTFNKDLASLEPEAFVADILVDQIGVGHVVTGYDFHFGHGRKGSPQTMSYLGQQLGFKVTVVEQVTDDSGIAPFSSSSIRAALRHGKVKDAADQLGYWWTLTGEVVDGDRRGRTIGFPTANIVLESGCEPAEGIYALRVRDANQQNGPVWFGAGYVGKRPTFETDRLFLEIHLLDFDGDLYGKQLAVEFVDYIRADRKFPSVDELTTQMRRDCAEIRQRLTAAGLHAPVMSFLDRAAGVGER